MSVLGLGVDIVEIERFASAIERSGQAFLDRVFLPAEQASIWIRWLVFRPPLSTRLR